ncbi:MAG TPA: glycosyltransferase [Gemmataceae bacterium]|nr:glycosyltransferase [Gemmataceae bacterium]
MRLTLVTETFPPEVNGVARTLGRWADTFGRYGHDVQVIRPRQPGERGAPGLVFALPLPFYPEVRLGLVTPGRLRRLLREFAPDLVHVATEGPLGLAALFAGAELGVPIVSSFHTHYDEYLGHYGFPWLGPAGRAYLRWFHNRTAPTLVPGEATRRRLMSHGYRNVEIWPRGVDGQHFHPRYRDERLRASLGLRPDDPLILYVGRLAPEKNLPALLDAFARLSLGVGVAGAARLALVGGGPLADWLRASRRPGVVMPGYQHGDELSRWYASADVFAFPSLTETFGNVILEAQASGLPVVGFDCPALRERVTPGHDGLLVAVGDDFAAAVGRLCRDGEERRRMGVAARRTAEGHGWGPIFDRLEARYRQAVVENSAREPRTGPATLQWRSARWENWRESDDACRTLICLETGTRMTWRLAASQSVLRSRKRHRRSQRSYSATTAPNGAGTVSKGPTCAACRYGGSASDPVPGRNRGSSAAAGRYTANGVRSSSLGVEAMSLTIEVVHENGALKPVRRLPHIPEGTRVWVTLHVAAEEDRARKAYGLIGWAGDAETVRRVALDPEFDVLEGP